MLTTTRSRSLLLSLLSSAAATLPAQAGFEPGQQQQTIHLAYGQQAATVTFCTADGSTITKAKPDCDCTTLRWEGSRLVAHVDTSGFDASVAKHITATTSDGQRTTLTMRFEVPQAVLVSPPSLTWERGSEPRSQEFRLRIPEGSPVRALIAADLSGDAFDYRASTLTPGREYAIIVTPVSTAHRVMNRLIIRMDSSDPRYATRLLYLRVR